MLDAGRKSLGTASFPFLLTRLSPTKVQGYRCPYWMGSGGTRKQLEKECAELEQQATRLAEEIKELFGEAGDRLA